MLPRITLLLIPLAGCQIQLGTPSGLAVACASDKECPKDLVCAATTQRCVALGSDTTPPTLASAATTDANTLAVTFDEPLNAVSASLVANYVVSGDGPAGPIVVHNATLDSTGLQVTLFIDETWPGQAYSVAATHIADVAGNVSTANGSAAFNGYGAVDPTFPVLLSPNKGAVESVVAGAQPVTLSWTARTGARAYILQVSTASDFTSFGDDTAPLEITIDRNLTSLSFPDDTVGAPALGPLTYYWRVRADAASPAFATDTPFSWFDALAEVVYVYCPASDTCSDTGRVGNKTKPAQSIDGGIGFAVANGRSVVHISGRGGTAAYSEIVNIAKNVSLYGGYAPNGEDRNPSLYPAIIRSEASTQMTAVNIDSGTTVIDGLTIDGGLSSSRGSSWGIVATDCTDAFTLSNCLISAGGSAVGSNNCQSTVGVEITGLALGPDQSPLIIGNHIETPPCGDPFVSTVATGLVVTDASPRIFDNYIAASSLIGNSTSEQLRTVGANLSGSTALVVGNTIVGGSVTQNGTVNTGISIGIDTGGGPTFVNNVIQSQPASLSIGIGFEGTDGTSLIANNTIIVSNPVDNGWGADVLAGCTLAGNLIAENGAGQYDNFAIQAHTKATPPMLVSHNALGGFVTLYSDHVSEQTTMSGMDTSLGAASVANQLAAPNSIDTFGFGACASGSSDYCLATPSIATTGGLDASAFSCASADMSICSFTVNRDGSPRQSPFSIGAY